LRIKWEWPASEQRAHVGDERAPLGGLFGIDHKDFFLAHERGARTRASIQSSVGL